MSVVETNIPRAKRGSSNLDWSFGFAQPKNHKIGWQNWDVVELESKPALSTAGNISQTNGSISDPEAEGDIEGVDESLPLDTCIFPPWQGFTDYCAPASTPAQDSRLGKWVRVDKDINKRSGIWYSYIYYRRSRRFDVPYITSLKIIPSSGPPPPSYTKSTGDDLTSGSWPALSGLSLAYKLQAVPGAFDGLDDSIQDEAEFQEADVITEIDILWGDASPWWGFKRIEPPIKEGTKRFPETQSLVVRMGIKPLPPKPELRFHANGTFRIMQVADLHYSTGVGVCKDTEKTPCVGDVDSALLLDSVLDAETPDMVIFSGDQLNGQQTSWDSMSVLSKFAKPVIDRKIPWALVFGNHDDENDLSRKELMSAISRMPYSVSIAGDKDVDGVGNYLLKVYSHDPSKTHLASIYMIDSGSYQKATSVFQKTTGYDYIKQSQIDWYLSTSSKIGLIERPFQPDTASDLEGIWTKRKRGGPKRTRQINTGERTLVKPNALMFFHIPLPEHINPADLDPDTGVPLDTGLLLDTGGSSSVNSGFFENGIKQATTGKIGKNKKEMNEVRVISNGHVHIAENCRRIQGIWMCFGGGGSYSGYGRIGFERRFRIFDISEFGERISTYKHTESGKIIDQMDLVGGDAPVL
ncbi:Predicted DNA repair exonuclease SIA1 [Phaffia rhodozyma]|uniref:Predicted DNA repair exonuclease SIA1 n=1 Tax=Phaffia rhodozyma TaxID=264483 RepID=A0A0F7SG70_PHARH|nr:Predicted DNA repair exonuclease SIA1 [Phaffia rhodozyma]